MRRPPCQARNRWSGLCRCRPSPHYVPRLGASTQCVPRLVLDAQRSGLARSSTDFKCPLQEEERGKDRGGRRAETPQRGCSAEWIEIGASGQWDCAGSTTPLAHFVAPTARVLRHWHSHDTRAQLARRSGWRAADQHSLALSGPQPPVRCVCVCVCPCARTCVRACVRACVSVQPRIRATLWLRTLRFTAQGFLGHPRAHFQSTQARPEGHGAGLCGRLPRRRTTARRQACRAPTSEGRCGLVGRMGAAGFRRRRRGCSRTVRGNGCRLICAAFWAKVAPPGACW